jgi:hypothetical protein
MVDALGSPASPPRGPTVNIFCIYGERSQISVNASQGVAIDIFKIAGGHSQISVNASRGPTIDIFKIGGGRSQISGITTHGREGGRGQLSMFFCVDSGRDQIFSVAS